MVCAYKENQDGFTLVEISIVMIIIGLLIGGTFGGMKLIENMQVNKTVQDFKSIQSAAITFKNTYGRLPGDIASPSTRLPNCTDAPCATGGNGNRIIGQSAMWGQTITAASENYTFWHHLQAADLLSSGVNNTLDMSLGQGQPESPINGGYISMHWGNQALGPPACYTRFPNHGIVISGATDGNWTVGSAATVPCSQMKSLDSKIDDGSPHSGTHVAGICYVSMTCGAEYLITGSGRSYFNLGY